MIPILTLIFGGISGYLLNIIAMKISFKQRTIDYKIKVYDSLITNWVAIRNHLFHFKGEDKWLELDKIYGQSQTYIGEAFLLSDDQQLLMDIDQFNENFVRTNWSELSLSDIYTHMERLKTEGVAIIRRMKSDIHESTRFNYSDLSHVFKGFFKE